MTCACKLCPECHGSGYVLVPDIAKCKDDGEDYIVLYNRTCPVCGGDGLEDMCEKCRDELLELLK